MTKVKDAHLWERDKDDWYVEPAWCCDALFKKEKFTGWITDPCCGVGRVLDAANTTGYKCNGYDIVDRGAAANHKFAIADFFKEDFFFENIVCNPPYKYDDQFVDRAVKITARKIAVLLRAQWANGSKRSRWLEALPLRRVLALSPRPSMPPGAVIKAGITPGGGLQDYSWFIFEIGFAGRPEFGWCRRASDYE